LAVLLLRCPCVATLQGVTHELPIIFANVIDPVNPASNLFEKCRAVR
jgi:hypothetical protein